VPHVFHQKLYPKQASHENPICRFSAPNQEG
jgi:hypothetical protein